MTIDELDKTRIQRIALALLTDSPDGVRTKTIADDPRVADFHGELIATDEATYHSLVGRLLSKFSRIVAVPDAPDAKHNMLWRRA